MGTEIYHVLKRMIKEKFGASGTSVGDEGGFAPNIKDERDALDILMAAIKEANYEGKVKIAMDVAASEFWNAEK